MVRTARYIIENACYHVVNRGNQKQAVFFEEEDYVKYLCILKHYKRKYGFFLYAYCLMPNHIHLIIGIKGTEGMAKFMQGLTQTYTIWFNKKYKKVGRLWQGRFKSMVIQEDKYLIDCLGYVELNPVRAKLVLRPEDYAWSSWKERMFDAKTDNGRLIDTPENL